MIEFLLDRFDAYADKEAMVWNDESYSYAWLAEKTADQIDYLSSRGIEQGNVVVLRADFSPLSVSTWLALTSLRTIQVPLTPASDDNLDFFLRVSEAEVVITVDAADRVSLKSTESLASHPHYKELRQENSPGLVLFSSGITGEPKGAVHNMAPLLAKFEVQRHSYRTIAFLLYDHIGGINTLLYTLSNGGCLIVVADRSPAAILGTIERHRVELLPTSPSFMNRMLLSEEYQSRDLSSLSLVTYGTEPMAESTLSRFHDVFPDIRLLQTYGLSELGILRSKSKDSNSLWMRIGGEGFTTRVRSGLLEIRAESAMLGYLNAKSPFTEDGWFKTGDAVEIDGDWIKVLGRVSDIINVGGEKVYPAEVESVIQEMPEIDDVSVSSTPNAILGQAVVAHVVLKDGVDKARIRPAIRAHCSSRMERFKVPARVDVVDSVTYNARFKKMR